MLTDRSSGHAKYGWNHRDLKKIVIYDKTIILAIDQCNKMVKIARFPFTNPIHTLEIH